MSRICSSCIETRCHIEARRLTLRYVLGAILPDFTANWLIPSGAVEGCSSDVAEAVLREYLDPVDEETEDNADTAKQTPVKVSTEPKDS